MCQEEFYTVCGAFAPDLEAEDVITSKRLTLRPNAGTHATSAMTFPKSLP
jgi:hypothetical protein